jgi:AcrR family transcriptional regulator
MLSREVHTVPKAPAAPKKARVRHSPDVRQALIVKAAQDVIVERGMRAASARNISEACGISPGLLTYHFPSMDDLLVAALRSASADFTRRLVSSTKHLESASERLEALLVGSLPITAEGRRNWILWIEYWARAAHHAELAELHSENYAAWRQMFQDVITEGIESGEFCDVDAKAADLRTVALLDGIGMQATIGDRNIDPETAKNVLLGLVKSLRA